MKMKNGMKMSKSHKGMSPCVHKALMRMKKGGKMMKRVMVKRMGM